MNFVEALVENFGQTVFSRGTVFFTQEKEVYRIIKIRHNDVVYSTSDEGDGVGVGHLTKWSNYHIVGVNTERTTRGTRVTFRIKWSG